MLHRPQPRSHHPHLGNRNRLEADDHRIVVEELKCPLDDSVAPVAVWGLQLDHHPNSSTAEVEYLCKCREPRLPAGPVVAHHQLAVGSSVYIELDKVGANLDGPLERG